MLEKAIISQPIIIITYMHRNVLKLNDISTGHYIHLNAETCSTVSLSLSVFVISAPCSINSWAHSKYPSSAAMSSGVDRWFVWNLFWRSRVSLRQVWTAVKLQHKHGLTIIIPSVKKSWHIGVVCEIKLWNIFGEFSYEWMAKDLIYHMTPTNLKIIYASVSTGHFC